MAKVFKGKQVFDSPEDYIKHLKALGEARDPFRLSMIKLKDEFATHLSSVLSPTTVNLYIGIVQTFVDFLYWQTDVAKIEEITKGMANSHFRAYWKQKVLNVETTPQELRTALRDFFTFLKNKKGMVNKKVFDSLKRS